MNRMLDTCICISLIRGRAGSIRERLDGFSVGQLVVSAITEAELRFGADKSRDPARNHRQLDLFFLTLPVLPFDRQAAVHYGSIRATLESAGMPIGPLDLLIAAHARAQGMMVVTDNVREFERVPGLDVENWNSD